MQLEIYGGEKTTLETEIWESSLHMDRQQEVSIIVHILCASTTLSTSYNSFIHQNPVGRNYYPHFMDKLTVTK